MTPYEEKISVHDLDVLVHADKLQLLYRQSFPSIFFSTFNAALLSFLLWSVQDHTVLLVWFAVLVLTAIGRLYLFISYRRVAPQGKDVLLWEEPYFITLMLTTLTWGIGCLLIMPTESISHQVIIYCFLVGMSGAAFSVYTAHRVIMLTTIVVMLLPMSVIFLISGDQILVGIVIAAIGFFLSAIRSTKVISLALHQNFTINHELKISSESADKLAHTDELTGLYNRRAFYEYGNILVNHSKRNKEELSIILMDIDHFKNINDNFGHAAGDVTLEQIGKILKQRLRKSDIFARVGGEEFGMLLSASTSENAALLAEQLRRVIAETPVIFNEQSFSITASFGVAGGVLDIDSLVKRSDAAMYQAKESGRNCVVCDNHADQVVS